MECNEESFKRQVKVVITKEELIEIISQKKGRKIPFSATIELDDWARNRYFYLSNPTFKTTISWSEELKND